MNTQPCSMVISERIELASAHLQREVKIDIYLPPANSGPVSLLLLNDGQDLSTMHFSKILEEMYSKEQIKPLLCVGIHAGAERKMEYGTATMLDYKGRGAKAKAYTDFIFEELMPHIRLHFNVPDFIDKSFAGFSLGALSALDIVWQHPHEFLRAGVFSGSLWWRKKDQLAADYADEKDRIMHQLIRSGDYYPWLQFFFECGAADEEDDRNNNGIIDSIDDTLDLIKELTAKGYVNGKNIRYLQIDDGKHDVETWARAMPAFLEWGWGRVSHE